MNETNFTANKRSIFEKLEREEGRLRRVLLADREDFEELQSDWQERDSPAERNLREVEWYQYSQLQEELSEIERARQRVLEGIYGICEDCGEKISAKRLSNMLTARRCIKCQEQSEKNLGLTKRNMTL